ncbi:Putative Amidohydrolase family protein [[Torrubiella] hemipterigena]|uniref:Putative Amidohydrolase family protein n=1 Tax=[Torrubiella] hemipterigena TaxID=1531966 RepID=A0A0A1TSY1_9HYPO|nr:Putative Amidohydrolase family protein [[Torrubiella] hemipterigena]
MSQDNQLLLPIIDSHIHLYPQDEVDNLAWCTPDHPLYGQRSIEQYKAAAASAPSLLGFIFVETDRKNDVAAGEKDGSGWDGPLREVAWMKRLVTGEPKDGQGHTAADAKLCLGMVPWAPIPSGPEILAKYIDKVKETAGDAWPKIKGFRYLLQDKPHGTMLEPAFIESLKLLGRRGLTFEVGIDQHRRGKKQLDEALEMIGRAHDDVPKDEQVTFILNHLCKPDLSLYNTTTDPSFTAWRTALYALGKHDNVYMKLSGCFSEMPETLVAQSDNASHVFKSIVEWLGVVLATFGPDRIMFGSDWPVCTVGIGEEAWPRWKEIVDKTCWMASLSDIDRAMVYGGTAKKAYNL